jgi:hypothetical protein
MASRVALSDRGAKLKRRGGWRGEGRNVWNVIGGDGGGRGIVHSWRVEEFEELGRIVKSWIGGWGGGRIWNIDVWVGLYGEFVEAIEQRPLWWTE